MEAQDRYVPPFRPRPRSRRTGDPNTTPAPADSRAGAAQEEGARPPFARNGGATGHTGKAAAAAAPVCPQGKRRNEVRHGTGHAMRDSVGEGTCNAPSLLSPWTARATPEGMRRPPSRFARRGDTQTRGARGDENERTSAPLAPRHWAACEWGGGGGRAPTWSGAPFSPGWRAGATWEPERAEAASLPWNPPPRGFVRKGANRRPRRSAPPPPPREPGSPPPICTPGAHGPGGARPGGVQIGRRAPVPRPPLHTRATRIHVPPLCAKRNEHYLPSSSTGG
ncbi:hypothetical protein EDB86DRAFT_2831325 [Lactarius hatsudake]|nr:hypothetical protein EDB86DRAFT_2831325 [Lactarius hatsudake]